MESKGQHFQAARPGLPCAWSFPDFYSLIKPAVFWITNLVNQTSQSARSCQRRKPCHASVCHSHTAMSSPFRRQRILDKNADQWGSWQQQEAWRKVLTLFNHLSKLSSSCKKYIYQFWSLLQSISQHRGWKGKELWFGMHLRHHLVCLSWQPARMYPDRILLKLTPTCDIKVKKEW